MGEWQAHAREGGAVWVEHDKEGVKGGKGSMNGVFCARSNSFRGKLF